MLYLILANFYLACFFALYWVAFRKQTFFRWNRLYLLAGLALAFLLPTIDLSAWYTYPAAYPTYLRDAGEAVVVQGGAIDVSASTAFGWKTLLVWVYAVGCILSFLYFLWRMVRTVRQLRTAGAGSAFSFFGAIRVDLSLVGHEQIEAHEQVHAKEWHSADLIVMQFVKVFNWFNPVVYQYERALRMQHEYLADDLTAAGDELAYAELLVARAMRVERTALVHTFSGKRGLKSRVAMLLQDKSHQYNLLRYLLLLPLVGAMVMCSIASNPKSADAAEGDMQAARQDVRSADDVEGFLQQLGKNVDYAQAAIDDQKQGPLAFTFEKAENGHIENVRFINELWEGQQAQVLNVLQRTRTDSVAPVGKYLVTIEFRLSDGENMSKEKFPPPPPVSSEYTILPSVVIIGYSPKKANRPAPPMVTQVTDDAKEPVSDHTVFETVEVAPAPKGGMKAFMEWVGKHYDFPQEAIDAGVNGAIQVAFVVEKDGSITNMKLVKDLGYGTGEAALRLLQNVEKWSPGIQNGKPVRVAYTLPIRLNLQQ